MRKACGVRSDPSSTGSRRNRADRQIRHRQQAGDPLGPPAVEVQRDRLTERLGQAHGLVTDLEGQQQVASRCEDPPELREHPGQLVVGMWIVE